jgi:hypothetical protein
MRDQIEHSVLFMIQQEFSSVQRNVYKTMKSSSVEDTRLIVNNFIRSVLDGFSRPEELDKYAMYCYINGPYAINERQDYFVGTNRLRVTVLQTV